MSSTRSTACPGDLPFRAFAFGLNIAANLGIPGLLQLEGDATPDVQMRLGDLPEEMFADEVELFQQASEYRDREPNLRVWRSSRGDYYRLLYQDGTHFLIAEDGSRVWGMWPAGVTLEDTATYLLGPVIGLVLRLRGSVSLHASAAEINGELAVFAGGAGAGKSSLGAALALNGRTVTGDDVLPLQHKSDVFLACSAYGRIRLWPDSAAALCGDAERLPRLTPTWDKRFLNVEHQLVRGYRRIGAIYLLQDSSDRKILFERLTPREALLGLVANTYANYLLDSSMRAEEFEFLSKLVSRVSVYRLHMPKELQSLRENAKLVSEHFTARQ